MPLSEHEQRLLEQMERALYAEDPKFASALRGPTCAAATAVVPCSGGFGVIVGLALLPVGIASQAVLLSVLGFLVMLGSAFFAVSSWRRAPAPGDAIVAQPSGGRGRKNKSKAPKPKMMDRLEERWRRRREGDGR